MISMVDEDFHHQEMAWSNFQRLGVSKAQPPLMTMEGGMALVKGECLMLGTSLKVAYSSSQS